MQVILGHRGDLPSCTSLYSSALCVITGVYSKYIDSCVTVIIVVLYAVSLYIMYIYTSLFTIKMVVQLI